MQREELKKIWKSEEKRLTSLVGISLILMADMKKKTYHGIMRR